MAMLPIALSLGTVGMLSRVSRAATLVSQHTPVSGWIRPGALNANVTRSPCLGKSFSDAPSEPYKPGEPIPKLNFAHEEPHTATWDTSGAVDMRAFFNDPGFSGDISNWDVSRVKSMAPTTELPPTPFDVDTSKWELSLLKDAQDPQAEPPALAPPSTPAP